MSRFYITPAEIGTDSITISGIDYNHIKNVLRMKQGDSITVCDGLGTDYLCEIMSFEKDFLLATIREKVRTSIELPVKLVLYQGLPKSDKMEMIIQKAVELGAAGIVPVDCKRCVMKLEEEKKIGKKIERWQAISESAAKQSGRGFVPVVSRPIPFCQAISEAAKLGPVLLPYENAEGMTGSNEVLEAALTEALSCPSKQISIFIGPEGGFDPKEIELAISENAGVVSLGKRILRTETAGLAILSVLMFRTEVRTEQ